MPGVGRVTQYFGSFGPRDLADNLARATWCSCPSILGTRRHTGDALPGRPAEGRVPPMQSVARFLQIVGLTIPPLAMVAQLSENISAGQMLQFLVASVCLFVIGYLLQAYRGSE